MIAVEPVERWATNKLIAGWKIDSSLSVLTLVGRCLKVSSNAAGEVATTSDPFLGHISATAGDKLHQRPYGTGPGEAISTPLCGRRRQRNEEKPRKTSIKNINYSHFPLTFILSPNYTRRRFPVKLCKLIDKKEIH